MARKKTAKLIIPTSTKDKSINLPIYSPTLGNDVIDVSKIIKNNVYSFDPGYMSTASCESKITYIDGDNGVLLYRGYPIEELTEQSNFMEVAYLLLYGELPDNKVSQKFLDQIKSHTMVHEQINRLLYGFRRDAHPMAVMLGVVGGLSAFYHDVLDFNKPENRELATLRIIAKIPTIAAMCYKYSIGQQFMQPQNHLNYASNFLHMLFAVPSEQYELNPSIIKAIDRIFIMHADHEQNASTSTVRLAGSTGANPLACISAGIAALGGYAHGGANEACLNMLKSIGKISNIPKYIKKAKDPNDPFRLMGFGHRVYKNYDPRARLMRQTCHEVLNELDSSDQPLFKLALKLEKIALEDEYFIKRKLYPNVDFYTGLTFSAIGIPTSMFTVMFVIARTIGWISHWNEMINTNSKLSRPRQLYTGPKKRKYVNIEKRSKK